MPREHVSNGMLPVAELYAHVSVGNSNRLAVVAAFHACFESPSEERHFETRKRQDRPETLECHQSGNGERDNAHSPEEQECGAHAERTVRTDFDALQLGLH